MAAARVFEVTHMPRSLSLSRARVIIAQIRLGALTLVSARWRIGVVPAVSTTGSGWAGRMRAIFGGGGRGRCR